MALCQIGQQCRQLSAGIQSQTNDRSANNLLLSGSQEQSGKVDAECVNALKASISSP